MCGPTTMVSGIGLEASGGDAVEIALAGGRRADDQRPHVGAAEVGEVVRDVAGSEGEFCASPREELILELKGELAVEHVERLVEVVVMQRRPRETGGNDIVHNGEVPSALLAAQNDVDPGSFS